MQFRGSSLKQVNSFLTDYDSSLYGISFSIGRFVWLFFFFFAAVCALVMKKFQIKGKTR